MPEVEDSSPNTAFSLFTHGPQYSLLVAETCDILLSLLAAPGEADREPHLVLLRMLAQKTTSGGRLLTETGTVRAQARPGPCKA